MTYACCPSFLGLGRGTVVLQLSGFNWKKQGLFGGNAHGTFLLLRAQISDAQLVADPTQPMVADSSFEVQKRYRFWHQECQVLQVLTAL